MTLLVIGLIVFLGVHSTRIFAEAWRGTMVQRLGANGWKGVYSLVSLVGLALIVVGYGAARADP
ncbi:MAG: NnrU family protein, partial [Burkholderiales bacterium]|nr:NnrU family protein [Burkholderiales bacterium]